MLRAAMNLPAFARHTACGCLEDSWAEARTAKRVGKRFLEHLRPLTADLVVPDRRTLTTPLVTSKPPPEIANQLGG